MIVVAKYRVSDVLKATAWVTGVSEYELVSKRGGERVWKARAAMCRVAIDMGHSFAALGRAIGRDHTTILTILKTDRGMWARYRDECERIRAATVEALEGGFEMIKRVEIAHSREERRKQLRIEREEIQKLQAKEANERAVRWIGTEQEAEEAKRREIETGLPYAELKMASRRLLEALWKHHSDMDERHR